MGMGNSYHTNITNPEQSMTYLKIKNHNSLNNINPTGKLESSNYEKTFTHQINNEMKLNSGNFSKLADKKSKVEIKEQTTINHNELPPSMDSICYSDIKESSNENIENLDNNKSIFHETDISKLNQTDLNFSRSNSLKNSNTSETEILNLKAKLQVRMYNDIKVKNSKDIKEYNEVISNLEKEQEEQKIALDKNYETIKNIKNIISNNEGEIKQNQRAIENVDMKFNTAEKKYEQLKETEQKQEYENEDLKECFGEVVEVCNLDLDQ